MINFDWTIHVSDFLVIGGGVFVVGKVFLSLRDAIHDLAKAVGTKEPPDGLLGDMVVVQGDLKQHTGWLIEMRARLGFK